MLAVLPFANLSGDPQEDYLSEGVTSELITGIGAAATAHFAAATPNCRYIEFLPPFVAESALRRELVQEELQIDDGKLDLPRRPGLGVELNPAAVRRFANGAKEYVEARRGFSVSERP